MGGNYVVDGKRAERIDLVRTPRELVVLQLNILIETLTSLLGCGRIVTSGSSRMIDSLFTTEEFLLQYKSTFGDIDLMVDKKHRVELERSVGTIFIPNWKFLGGKRSSGQYITLWENTLLRQNIQVDFEFVEYEEGSPTIWSRFSRWSDSADVLVGVRAVYHKLLLRALTARSVKPVVLVDGTKMNTNTYSFSVLRGLRNRFRNESGSLILLKPENSVYMTDIQQIVSILFSCDDVDTTLAWSFVGCLSLMKQLFSEEDVIVVRCGFCDLLFGDNSQKLSSDPLQDRIEKRFVLGVFDRYMGLS